MIRKVLGDFMQKELYDYQELAYDTDNVIYKIYGDEARKEFRFCYRSNCTALILANGGRELLEERYAQHMVPEEEWDPEFDITLRIDLSAMPQTKKVKKSMSDEEADAIRAENENIRLERKNMIEPIAERLSLFKMEFMSAPIRHAFNQCLKGTTIEPLEVPYREDEKYWVITHNANETQVYFSVNFKNDTDV